MNNCFSYYYEVKYVFTHPDAFAFSKGSQIINENRIEATYLAGGDAGTFTAIRSFETVFGLTSFELFFST